VAAMPAMVVLLTQAGHITKTSKKVVVASTKNSLTRTKIVENSKFNYELVIMNY
jgi:hypothetical protein